MKIQTSILLLVTLPGLFAAHEPPMRGEKFSSVLDTANGNQNTLFRRAYSGPTTCDNSTASSVFTRFNGIFFGNFATTGGQVSVGPLAVGGSMSSTGYEIDADASVGNCRDLESSFDSYGLVVGGSYANSRSNSVRGAAFLPPRTDIQNLKELQNGCPILTARGTGLFDFTQASTNAIFASKYFSAYFPTLVLRNTGTLTRTTPPHGDFDTVTMNTCQSYFCGVPPPLLSDPSRILFGNGAWNGPNAMSWPAQLIVNIPVQIGRTLTITGKKPSLGMTVCSTIFNIYPVNSDGSYESGKIYVNRDSSGTLGGFILAPEADIIDSSRGNFAGLVVGNNYQWSGSGVELRDYAAAGGNCPNGFTGCFPITNDTEPTFPKGPPLRFTIPSDVVVPSTTYSTVTETLSSTEVYETVDSVTYITVTITPVPSSAATFDTVTTDIYDNRTFVIEGGTFEESIIGAQAPSTITVLFASLLTSTNTSTSAFSFTNITSDSNNSTNTSTSTDITSSTDSPHSTITVISSSTLLPPISPRSSPGSSLPTSSTAISTSSTSNFDSSISTSITSSSSATENSNIIVTTSTDTFFSFTTITNSAGSVTTSTSTSFSVTTITSTGTTADSITTISSRSKSSSDATATENPPTPTATPSNLEYIYCTYGGSPHFHIDKLFENYEHEEYDDIPGLHYDTKPWYMNNEEHKDYKAKAKYAVDNYYHNKKYHKHKDYNNYPNKWEWYHRNDL